ncbi:hypothetical protein O181_020139 [Austropuccinia psidii MF-1]|uniref:Uncharacterized protein n=1 Tax=Austropuccinia psidii MF-1 TaxID=1389203 RepID=A0A9Q3CAS2_9BASI|nr:hypothetical protein [Austropuccinia psidii MF-1]
MLVLLSDKHTRNACLLSNPSDHAAREVPGQDTLARTPLWSTIIKAFPRGNVRWDNKQADGNACGKFTLSLQVSICPPPPRPPSDGPFTPLLGQSLVTYGLQTPKTKPTESPQPDTPVPHMPRKQTPRQSTPSQSGTRLLEDLFSGKQQAIPFIIPTPESSELNLPPFVEPFQHNERTIPGPSHFSKPQVPSQEDAFTCEPEPEEAPTQSKEEPSCKSPLHLFYSSQLSLTPPLTISSSSCYTPSVLIINDTPVRAPPPCPPFLSWRSCPLPPPLSPTMRLGRNLPIYTQTS